MGGTACDQYRKCIQYQGDVLLQAQIHCILSINITDRQTNKWISRKYIT